MTATRGIPILLALSCAMLFAGCGDPAEPSGAGSGGTTAPAAPAPSQAAAAEWAGRVCAASADLRQSVTGGPAMPFDATSSSTSVEQVRDRVTAVQQSATAVRAALSDAPAGVDAQLTGARQQLQTDAERAQAAIDELGSAADKVTAANSRAEVAAAMATLTAAFSGTATDVATYLASLRDTIAGKNQAVRDAFGAAPACQALAASASAPASR